MGPIHKILIVRTDRLGDVLLTTPVSRLLKEHDPALYVAWLVRPYTAPLLEHNPDVDEVITDPGGSVKPLIRRLREGRFDAAIIAYPRWRAAWATCRAAIPVRIGPASKLYSAFFSERLWQHRSESARHEADYNLELLAPMGIPFRRTPTRLVLTDKEKLAARKRLESERVTFRKPVVILHPGSGGSSSRWPLAHFIELGDRLQETGCDVVVTGGPGEDYQYTMIDQMRRQPVFMAAGSVGIRELAALLSCASLVVTNSTGPLHMAVAMGTPTVSVYSPVAACHPRRWGPYPAYVEGNAAQTVMVAPERGPSEADMAAVTVDQVWECCRKKLSSPEGIRV